jgi:aryl-alcohol dehydrogenase-like predicted oxidoreductase
MVDTPQSERDGIGAVEPGRWPAPRLGLGCGTFGREITEAEAYAVMDYAVAHGITLFDTAEAYGGGQARALRRSRYGLDDVREVSDEMHSSEKIVGRWLASRGLREQVLVVTKVTRNFQPEAVRTALAASLARLQTGYIDLYFYHTFDPTVPPEAAALAMDGVIRSGLARAGGVSNYSAAQIGAALAAARSQGCSPFRVVELCGNLLRFDRAAFDLAQREGLGTLAYSPLAAGFLTGKYSSERTMIPKGTRFDVMPQHADLYFTERNFSIVQWLKGLALETGIPAAQLALAWVCHQPMVSTVLVGARHPEHLANALAASRIELPPPLLERMNRWSTIGQV